MQHYGVGSCGFIVPKKEFDRTKNFLKAQQLVKMMNKLTGKQVSKNVISFYLTSLTPRVIINPTLGVITGQSVQYENPSLRVEKWPKSTI